jgi:sigma-B regulation protein RsbU (phosphoserine phosphatase)
MMNSLLFEYNRKSNRTKMIEVLKSILALLGTASFIIVIGLICVRLNVFKSSLKNSTAGKLAVAAVFGILAIYGTLMGTQTSGAIVNVRELAAMIAGVVGGPVSGLVAGLIGGVHRYTVGGFTAVACSVSTVLLGVIAGFARKWLTGKMCLLKGAVVGLVLESFAMALILVLAQPFTQAVSTVEQIALPMITADTVGLVLWLFLFNHNKSASAK